MASSMEAAGKALAKVEPPTDDEIAAIRKRGTAVVAHNREVGRFVNMLRGTEWGGAASDVTLAIVAEFCKVIGAHPVYHIDILGGRPYPNAQFWSDRLNSDERFVDYAQVNISNDAAAREHYGVPAWAEMAYETIVRKLVAFAPIERIRAGDITDWQQFVVETREAAWAGGKGKNNGQSDPVGDAHPSKTARTRSLRRAGARAFSAWMAKYEEQITKAERALEAEWEDIKPTGRRVEQRAALTSGNGEPTAASSSNAQPLPVEDRTSPQPSSKPDGGNGESRATSSSPSPDFDEAEAQGRYFQHLRWAFGPSHDRKDWQVKNGLSASIKEFGPAGYAKAFEIMAPLVAEMQQLERKAHEGAKILGFDNALEYVSARKLPKVTWLQEWRELADAIAFEVDQAE